MSEEKKTPSIDEFMAEVFPMDFDTKTGAVIKREEQPEVAPEEAAPEIPKAPEPTAPIPKAENSELKALLEKVSALETKLAVPASEPQAPKSKFATLREGLDAKYIDFVKSLDSIDTREKFDKASADFRAQIKDFVASYEKQDAEESELSKMKRELEEVKAAPKIERNFQHNLSAAVKEHKWESVDTLWEAVTDSEIGSGTLLHSIFKIVEPKKAAKTGDDYVSALGSWFRKTVANDPFFIKELSIVSKAKAYERNKEKELELRVQAEIQKRNNKIAE